MSRMLLAVALALATLAQAAPPTMVEYTIDRTTRMGRFSTACGFPVYRHIHAVLDIKLFTAGNGQQVVRETDTTPGGKATFFSPLELGGTGGSYDVPLGGHEHYLYPDGVYLGAPAVEILVGMYTTNAPGSPYAGQETYLGEIIDIDENGVPLVGMYWWLAPESHGHHSLASSAPKVCAMLQR